MYKEACKLFREADEIFNNNFVNEGQFNDRHGLYNQYCPVKNGSKSCDNNYEKIGAIGGYIFMELNGKHSQIHGSATSSSGRYIEYFIIWISHILYKVSKSHLQSVDQIYKNTLRKYIGNFNFWNLTQNKKELKNANVATMNMLYVLFNQICETIETYQKPNVQAYEYVNKGVESKMIYDQLSQFVSQCGPYIEVLDHLKTVYNNLIETAKSEQIHGADVFDQFQEFSPIDNTNAGSELKSKECKQVHKKLIKNPPTFIKKEFKKLKSVIESNLQKASNSESSTLVKSQTQDGTELANPQSGLNILAISSEDEKEDNEEDDDDDGDSVDGDTVDGGTVDGGAVGGDAVGGDAVGGDAVSDDDSDYYSDDGGDDSDGENGNMENTEGTTDHTIDQLQQNGPLQSSSQDKTQDSQKETPPTPVPEPPPEPLPQPQPQTQPQPPQPEQQKDGQKKGDQSGPSQPSVSEPGSEKNQRTSNTSPKDPSSEQNDSGSMNFQNILSSVKNTIEKYGSSAYKTITNVGNTLYEKASSTLENVYDQSKNFASNTINYVRDQLNKALENDQQSKEKKPKPAPSLPDGKQPESQGPQTPKPTDQRNDNPQKAHSTQKDGSPDNKQVNPSDPPPEKQPQPSIDHSNKAINTGIKSENPGTIVKENIPQLVKIKNTYREYNRPEVVITVVLTPIILLIIYKYLSSVWRKELKRKKNVKKVINSIGGKKSVQIIIKSVDTKKMANPVIKPVRGEKKSLLNIYKLMQADPVPFINLFFLLIFFVYKRRLDSIE
ncbi:CIR protein PIR protein [Plasmodium vinckei brucechwatti]|uniref:CIR protein PIR protein n=1 Tax=Plasmodium vinckei brucechwatti TaxID=119398 RepID=A0A6V7S4R6_PLAVN|nr:CIR protein PIR protein [Plasmodium vinckei brucechwatti]